MTQIDLISNLDGKQRCNYNEMILTQIINYGKILIKDLIFSCFYECRQN